MIIMEFEDLRSGRNQTIEFPGTHVGDGEHNKAGRLLATVRLTAAGRAGAHDAGAWTGIATYIDSGLLEELTHIVTRTARRTGHRPPFALDCRSLPPILAGTLDVVRLQVGEGGPEFAAEPEVGVHQR
jgi:hypothetical protein